MSAEERLPVGAYVAAALMAANIACDSGEDVDRFLAELDKRGVRVSVPTEPGAPDHFAAFANERSGVIEYIEADRTLVWTDRISKDEYGASAVIADHVLPWFGRLAASQPVPAPEPSARLREAGDDLYRALSSEHGHGPLGEAPWPSCLPVHLAMNGWLAATPQDPEETR